MTRRVVPRALATLAILASMAAAGWSSAPSASADDEPIVYVGTRTVVNTTADGAVIPQDSGERTVTLTCADGRCAVDGVSLLFHDEEIVLVDGVATYSFPATGTACDDPDTRALDATFSATATGFTGEIVIAPQSVVSCSETTSSERTGAIHTFDLALVSGDPCGIDGSCVTATPEASPTALATPVTANSLPRDGATPSILSTLQSLPDATAPRNLAWAAIGTLVLVLLLALPTELFNRATGTASARLSAWWAKRRGTGTTNRGFVLSGFPAAAGGVAAAALISAFVDPRFGIDLASLRTVGSILTGFAVTVVVGWFALIAVVRRTHPTSTPRFEFAPPTLIVVALAVLFSRLTSFEPGLVFGLVAGVTFAGVVATVERARLALVTLGYGFVVAILAWIGYSALSALPDPPGGIVFAQEALSSMTIAGVVALPVLLLPIRGLVGRTLWEWRKWGWALAYGVGLFAFLLVLLPLPSSWATVSASIWAWGSLYVGYLVAAVAAWLVIDRPWRRPVAEDS